MSFRKNVVTKGFRSWYLSMATLQCLPLPECEPCDELGGVMFIQRMSSGYIRNVIRNNLVLLVCSIGLSAWALMYQLGFINPSMRSGVRFFSFITWGGPVLVLMTGFNIFMHWMCRCFRREIRLAPDGSLSINGEIIRSAALMRSKVKIHDSSNIPPLVRATEAICLEAHGKIVIVATRDVRCDLDELSLKLGVGLEIGEDTIEVKGVV